MNNFSKIQNKIIKEEKLSLINSAIMTADIMGHYDGKIKSAMVKWADGEDVSKVTVSGASVEDVMGRLNCSVFQALCILNALKHDPKAFASAVLVLRRDEIRGARPMAKAPVSNEKSGNDIS